MQLAVAVYGATESFPKHEMYGLTNQLRRAAVSVPSNIAEGKGRHTSKEFS
jgi:four helix bundle protein